MQKLEVLIEENAFGGARPVEVIADAPVSMLVPALVEELNLPKTDLFGKQLVYMLRQSLGGRILPENATLIDAGVAPGTRLALDSYVIDGTVATLLKTSAPLPAVKSAPLPPPVADPGLYSSQTIADFGNLSAVDERHTSGGLPPLKRSKRPKKKTRRTFLLLSGVTLGAVGGGVAYAAYHGVGYTSYQKWITGILNNLKGTAKTTAQQNPITKPSPVIPPQPTLPTMMKAVHTFTRHQGTVRTVNWSPDGTLLASGADDAKVFIWNMNGTVQHTLGHPAGVRALAWSSDGKRLATASNTQITFYQTQTGTVIARPAQRHTALITDLAWASHGQMQVVSGGNDKRAIVWNTTNYQAQTIFTTHTTALEAVAWSADGTTVASASQGGVARVWRAATGQELHGLYLLDNGVPMNAAAFAPTGTLLAVGGNDGKVRLWNGITCQQQGNGQFGLQCMDAPQLLSVSTNGVRTLAWSLDGRFLAVGTLDGVLSIWERGQYQKPLLSMSLKTIVHSINWSPDGKYLASAAGNVVTIWQLM
jgi:dipeptidyl aminopeptidase/acylaminoacyl peptidase